MPDSKTRVTFISSSALELWDWRSPWTTGIGGSETSHIEMVERLKKLGYDVHSYAPIESTKVATGPADVPWRQHTQFSTKSPGVYIFYRNPSDLDQPKGKGQKWWFVAQDVDYPDQWTPARMAKVDRYICLCGEHARFTGRKYPIFRDRIYVSSNGIRREHIEKCIESATKVPLIRNPNRMFFPSSPDRGLKFLLEQWWRIREFNPKAELRVAYGFNNMEKIWGADPNDWRRGYQGHLMGLLKQEGVTFLGRLNQNQVYAEWLQTGIWAHPTDFPETSCITCMEAQALGAWPVTNKYWALEDNVKYGYMVDGKPQDSALVRQNWMHNLAKAFKRNKGREEMQKWALQYHDWDNVALQWSTWIQQDMK
jgi:hypothetical protein